MSYTTSKSSFAVRRRNGSNRRLGLSSGRVSPATGDSGRNLMRYSPDLLDLYRSPAAAGRKGIAKHSGTDLMSIMPMMMMMSSTAATMTTPKKTTPDWRGDGAAMSAPSPYALSQRRRSLGLPLESAAGGDGGRGSANHRRRSSVAVPTSAQTSTSAPTKTSSKHRKASKEHEEEEEQPRQPEHDAEPKHSTRRRRHRVSSTTKNKNEEGVDENPNSVDDPKQKKRGKGLLKAAQSSPQGPHELEKLIRFDTANPSGSSRAMKDRADDDTPKMIPAASGSRRHSLPTEESNQPDRRYQMEDLRRTKSLVTMHWGDAGSAAAVTAAPMVADVTDSKARNSSRSLRSRPTGTNEQSSSQRDIVFHNVHDIGDRNNGNVFIAAEHEAGEELPEDVEASNEFTTTDKKKKKNSSKSSPRTSRRRDDEDSKRNRDGHERYREDHHATSAPSSTRRRRRKSDVSAANTDFFSDDANRRPAPSNDDIDHGSHIDNDLNPSSSAPPTMAKPGGAQKNRDVSISPSARRPHLTPRRGRKKPPSENDDELDESATIPLISKNSDGLALPLTTQYTGNTSVTATTTESSSTAPPALVSSTLLDHFPLLHEERKEVGNELTSNRSRNVSPMTSFSADHRLLNEDTESAHFLRLAQQFRDDAIAKAPMERVFDTQESPPRRRRERSVERPSERRKSRRRQRDGKREKNGSGRVRSKSLDARLLRGSDVRLEKLIKEAVALTCTTNGEERGSKNSPDESREEGHVRRKGHRKSASTAVRSMTSHSTKRSKSSRRSKTSRKSDRHNKKSTRGASRKEEKEGGKMTSLLDDVMGSRGDPEEYHSDDSANPNDLVVVVVVRKNHKKRT